MSDNYSSAKTSDELVLDMAADMVKNIPEVIETQDPDPRPASQQPQPTLQDIVTIGNDMDLKKFKRKPAAGGSKKAKDNSGMYHLLWPSHLQYFVAITIQFNTLCWTVVHQ